MDAQQDDFSYQWGMSADAMPFVPQAGPEQDYSWPSIQEPHHAGQGMARSSGGFATDAEGTPARKQTRPVLVLAAALGVDETPPPERMPSFHKVHSDHSHGKRYVAGEVAIRWKKQLRSLLEFYFEAFNLQHNRLLLAMLDRLVRQKGDLVTGPIAPEDILSVTFDAEELCCLNRVERTLAALRTKIGIDLSSFLTMKSLLVSPGGQLRISRPPELRSHIVAKNATNEEAAVAARQLYALKEERTPEDDQALVISVFSYSMEDLLANESQTRKHRQARVKRQLVFHMADLMFFQGGPEDTGAMEDVFKVLIDQGYECIFGSDESTRLTNRIFFNINRLEHLSFQVVGSSLAADFNLKVAAKRVRAVCMKPDVPTTLSPSLEQLYAREEGCPLLVCGDFSKIGGAEVASIIEGLCELRSLSVEVLGEELPMPIITRPSHTGEEKCLGTPELVRSAASGFNRLHGPDAIFFEGMEPLLSLCGHSERYLATLSQEDVLQQFPTYHLPVIGCFRWS